MTDYFGPRVRISVSPHKRKASVSTLAFLRQGVSPSLLEGNDEGAKKQARGSGRGFSLVSLPLRDHERAPSEASTLGTGSDPNPFGYADVEGVEAMTSGS